MESISSFHEKKEIKVKIQKLKLKKLNERVHS